MVWDLIAIKSQAHVVAQGGFERKRVQEGSPKRLQNFPRSKLCIEPENGVDLLRSP